MAIPRDYKCPRKDSCITSDDELEVVCAEGYTGWLCSNCDKSFYSVINSCIHCPSPVYIAVEALLIFSVFVATYLFAMYRRKCLLKSKGARSFLYVLTSRIKIALGFYQVVGGLMLTLHNANRRKTLYIFGEILSVLQVNVLKIFVRPRCISHKFDINPKVEFIIETSLPLVIMLFASFFYFGKLKFATLKTNQLKDSHREKLKSKLISVVVISMFVMYPSMCTSIFQLYPWSCKTFYLDIQNKTSIKVLRSDFNISCADLTVYQYAAYLSTAWYVVAFPAILYLYLWTRSSAFRNQPNEIVTRNANVPYWMAFFVENSKYQYWYWEILELTRKMVQTFLITLLGWESKLAVLMSILISVLFLTLHERCMAMKTKFEQGLQMFSLFAILTNLVISAVNIPEEHDAAVSIILILLNAAVIVAIAVELVLNIALALKQAKFGVLLKKTFQKKN